MRRRAYLTLWRRKLPQKLRCNAGLPEDLAAFLRQKMAPRDEDERRLLDTLLRGGAGRREASLALGTRCAGRLGPLPDLAMSCVLLAALASSEPA